MPDLSPEYAELRRLAEAANADVVQGATYQRDWPLSSRAVGQFLRALTPDLALELLNAAAERDALVDKVARVRTVGDLTARHIGRQVRTGSGMSVPLDWAWFLTLTSGDLDTPCEVIE